MLWNLCSPIQILLVFSTFRLIIVTKCIPIKLATDVEADLLASFQNQVDNNNSTMLLLTKSHRYILIQETYEVENIANEAYFRVGDPIIGGYVYGLWLFYSKPNYNWNNDAYAMIPDSKVEWILSTNQRIFYKFNMNILSFRTPADSSQFNESAYICFMGHNFTGPSDIETDTNYPNTPFSKPKSTIVTGNDPWYVYTASNFVQKTLCIVPTNNHVLIGNYYAQQITKMHRHYNSVHKNGCSVRFVRDPKRPGRIKAEIIEARNEQNEDVEIRRIPPIFMRNENDLNRVNDLF